MPLAVLLFFNVPFCFSLLLLECEFNINLMSLLRFSYLFSSPEPKAPGELIV